MRADKLRPLCRITFYGEWNDSASRAPGAVIEPKASWVCFPISLPLLAFPYIIRLLETLPLAEILVSFDCCERRTTDLTLLFNAHVIDSYKDSNSRKPRTTSVPIEMWATVRAQLEESTQPVRLKINSQE